MERTRKGALFFFLAEKFAYSKVNRIFALIVFQGFKAYGIMLSSIKTLFVSIVSAIAAYLRPLDGELETMLAVFFCNCICGLLADIIGRNGGFKFKKAWRCIVESMVFFGLVGFIYFIGDHKGNPSGALQCVSLISYAIIWFYSTNILRNLGIILPNETVGHRCIMFLYYVASVEFVKKIPYLADFIGKEAQDESK
jgi:hypothetical protein